MGAFRPTHNHSRKPREVNLGKLNWKRAYAVVLLCVLRLINQEVIRSLSRRAYSYAVTRLERSVLKEVDSGSVRSKLVIAGGDQRLDGDFIPWRCRIEDILRLLTERPNILNPA